jgi:hypothetical protein
MQVNAIDAQSIAVFDPHAPAGAAHSCSLQLSSSTPLDLQPPVSPYQSKAAAITILQAKSPALRPGFNKDTIQLDVAANGAVLNIPVDVPAGAVWMNAEIESANGADVDLYVRGLSQFNDDNGPQFRSEGTTGSERIAVTQAATPGLSPGTWYLGVQNFASEATSVTLNVEIFDTRVPPLELVFDYNDPNCDDNSAWNDPTPFTPEGGNDATTLGQARRNAFEHALNLLGEEIRSPIPIPIQMCWADLGDGSDGDSVTLGSAGPTRILTNSPGVDVANTWYTAGAALSKAGTDYCRLFPSTACGTPMLNARFNAQYDDSNSSFYYGLEPSSLINRRTDFIALVMHEMAHGLGFLGLIDLDNGALLAGNDGVGRMDIYTLNVIEKQGAFLDRDFTALADMSDAERANAVISGDLRWIGPRTVYRDENANLDPDSQFDANAFPLNTPQLYSPSEVEGGSSFSHFDNQDRWGIMTPTAGFGPGQRTLGLAKYLLADVGWSESPSRIRGGLYFDPAQDGHGFDLYRPGDSNSLIFYTYDEAGRPTWELAVGQPSNRQLQANLQDFSNTGSLEAVQPNGSPNGAEVRLFQADYRGDEVCPTDDVVRDSSGPLYVLDIVNPDESARSSLERYCVQPFAVDAALSEVDFTGSWFDANEPGWGLSVQTLTSNGASVVVAVAYYYDAEGNPRWAIGQAPFEGAGLTTDIVMREAAGYLRGQTPVAIEFVEAGSIALTLNERAASEGAGIASIDLQYQGSEGGVFQRNNVPIQLVP